MKLSPQIKDNHLDIVKMRITVGNIEGVKNFIKNYPDVVNYIHSEQKDTLLTIAIHCKRKEVVDYLIDSKAPITPEVIVKAILCNSFSNEEHQTLTQEIKNKIINLATLKTLKNSLVILKKDLDYAKTQNLDLEESLQIAMNELNIRIEKYELENTLTLAKKKTSQNKI